MDGSGSTFFRDTPFFSSFMDEAAGGILYVEDFDLEPAGNASTVVDSVEPSSSSSALTLEDLELARQQGRADGLQAALADAQLVQAELQAAALQSLADALSAARSTLERVAAHHAAAGVRSVLATLQAAVPTVMAHHAACEVDAVLHALLPGLICEPELRLRAHPDLADTVRETLVMRLPQDGIVLSVVADPELAAGDIHVAWQNGQAKRDCTAIWDAIRAALAPIGLPAMKEICHGY